MKRTMRFEEALTGWRAERLTQAEAAQLLGAHDRTFLRYIDRYEEEGLDGLMDKRLAQGSARRAPMGELGRWRRCIRSATRAGT